MTILIFVIALIFAYISLYIVSLFSGQSSDPIAVGKATGIIWGLSVVLSIFGIVGVVGMMISTIVSMVTFMKILGFEPTSSFFAGMLYSVIYYILLLILYSIILG